MYALAMSIQWLIDRNYVVIFAARMATGISG